MYIEGYASPETVLLMGAGFDAINGGTFGRMAYECLLASRYTLHIEIDLAGGRQADQHLVLAEVMCCTVDQRNNGWEYLAGCLSRLSRQESPKLPLDNTGTQSQQAPDPWLTCAALVGFLVPIGNTTCPSTCNCNCSFQPLLPSREYHLCILCATACFRQPSHTQRRI
jgi:hypothetical protein